MTITDPATWQQRTERGLFTPRSSQLVGIDTALLAYKKTPSQKTLLAVSDAIQAWKKKKGANWSNSTRNTNGAMQELMDAVDKLLGPGGMQGGALAKAAVAKQLVAPAPVAPYPTLTDDNLVSQFANHVLDCYRNHWNTAQPATTGNKLMEGVSAVLQACGMPDVGISIEVLPAGYQGFFDFTRWRIQLSQAKFSTYAMVWNDPSTKLHPHSWFVNVAETIYHEARHAEQWWHIARYYGHGKAPNQVAATLAIPPAVAAEACARPMKHNDPLIGLTEGWYDSVYGGSNRGVVLHALGLKRDQSPSAKITPDEKAALGTQIHARYSGHLPEEVDAWAIQDLVRAKF